MNLQPSAHGGSDDGCEALGKKGQPKGRCPWGSRGERKQGNMNTIHPHREEAWVKAALSVSVGCVAMGMQCGSPPPRERTLSRRPLCS